MLNVLSISNASLHQKIYGPLTLVQEVKEMFLLYTAVSHNSDSSQ